MKSVNGTDRNLDRVKTENNSFILRWMMEMYIYRRANHQNKITLIIKNAFNITYFTFLFKFYNFFFLKVALLTSICYPILFLIRVGINELIL